MSMLDNDLISMRELLDLFDKKGIIFNEQTKINLLSFVGDGLEPLFFYQGDILRNVYQFRKYTPDYKSDFKYETIIDNVVGYLTLNDVDFKELLFNDYCLLGYPINESEYCPLVGSHLPDVGYNEKQDGYFVNFYTIDCELSIEDVFFARENLGEFLEWVEIKEIHPNTPTPANNDELATLQVQLDQAHARIAELEKVVEQSRATVTPIFDSQDSYTYPPELDVAIKIWLEIYQTDNIPKHLTNHSDKFTQACKNLGFSFTENAVKTRLKKVTTPQSQKEKTKNKNSLK